LSFHFLKLQHRLENLTQTSIGQLISIEKNLKCTCGISTAYLISSKVIERGSKGRIIPFLLFKSPSVMLPTLEDRDLEDALTGTSFPLSAYLALIP